MHIDAALQIYGTDNYLQTKTPVCSWITLFYKNGYRLAIVKTISFVLKLIDMSLMALLLLTIERQTVKKANNKNLPTMPLNYFSEGQNF